MSRWSIWVAERGWADVGLWVAVCFLAKISSHRPTCKTTFARLTQSQAISQSFRVFISFSSLSRRDTTFFHFSKLFLYKITVSFTMVIKRSPGGQACRWRPGQLRNPPVKFRQERWLQNLAIDQHPACPNGGRLELWPGNDSFWDKIRDAKHCWSIYSCHVDRRRWVTQVKIASTDLWPQRCLLFRKCLCWSSRKAVAVATSVIGGLGAP